YAAPQPFLYFCDYRGDLAKAIREGRRNEFASFGAFADEQRREQIPDPNAERTYLNSQLDHADRERSPHREFLEFTRELLRVRTERAVPLIAGIVAGAARYETNGHVLTVVWPVSDGTADQSVSVIALVLQANLGDAPGPTARADEI